MSTVVNILGLRYDELASNENFKDVTIPKRETIVDQSYVSFTDEGISLVLKDCVTVSAVQLHATGHEEFAGYAKPLPFGLTFDMSQAEVRNCLGEATKSGVEEEVLVLGKKPAWDKFIKGTIQVHIEYTFGANSIQLVTIKSR